MNRPMRVAHGPSRTHDEGSGVHAAAPHFDALRVLQRLGAAVLVVDRAGVVTFVNERGESILRRRVGELLGTDVSLWIAPIGRVLEAVEHDDEGRFRRQTEALTPDGQRLVLGYRVTVLDDRDPASPVAIVFQDITPWEQLRLERDRALRLAAVSDVLPSILHELKNPLAVVATSVELMLEEEPRDDQAEEFRAVLGEIHRMKLTLEGIGSVGRPLRSHGDEPVGEAVTEAVRVLKRRANGRGVSLHREVAGDLMVPFSATVVRGVLFNLITNALDACRPGDSVTVSAHRKGGTVALRVADTGVGMTPETLARCREMFYSTKSRGSGIGLALCDASARQAGGQLKVDSTPRVGTSVTLILPIEASITG